MTKLVDEALSKISEVGTIAAMKWLHEQTIKIAESERAAVKGFNGSPKYRINISKFYETWGWDANSGYEYYFHIEVSKDGMRGNAVTVAKEVLAEMKKRFPTPEFEVKGSIEYINTLREPFE